ncbi:hypothetical protein VLK81_02690 [Citroniella saccharovorans]|uniref:ABC transporter permease n=1 Tax=Citroniella saccharovorans TaxID=2053367 RepID=A0AAW9MSG7_9FIRM|nr:hypothetical protein [Citroniella saccharovorans]MEB3428941.1 hypothetical protein [Citroniella saccharovorans]
MNNLVKGIKDFFKADSVFKTILLVATFVIFALPIDAYINHKEIGLDYKENENVKRFQVLKSLKTKDLNSDELVKNYSNLFDKDVISAFKFNDEYYVFGDRDILSEYFNADEEININVRRKDISKYTFNNKEYDTSLIKRTFSNNNFLDAEKSEIYIVLPDKDPREMMEFLSFLSVGKSEKLFNMISSTMINSNNEDKISEFKKIVYDLDCNLWELEENNSDSIFYRKVMLRLLILIILFIILSLSYNFEGRILLYVREASIKNIEGLSLSSLLLRFSSYILTLSLISLIIFYILLIKLLYKETILFTFLFALLISAFLIGVVYFMLKRKNLTDNLRLDFKEGM